jgi:hypothetical protein
MSETEIVYLHGRRVWDSRGRPTVEAELMLSGGAVGRAIAPAGASTGSAEALDLRDGGETFGGYDVARAVANVNGDIAAAVLGKDAADQAALDAILIGLDGTEARTRLGGISGVRRRECCRCRKSRCSAAAPMPVGGSISRTCWWSAPPPAALPRRWTGPLRSTEPPAA